MMTVMMTMMTVMMTMMTMMEVMMTMMTVQISNFFGFLMTSSLLDTEISLCVDF